MISTEHNMFCLLRVLMHIKTIAILMVKTYAIYNKYNVQVGAKLM